MKFTRYLNEHWNYITQPGSYPGIDTARALAVSAVVFFHSTWLPIGWIGVDLFFVISGFLIGGNIIDKISNKRFSIIEFYRNRALRILPVYYVMIVLCVFFKAEINSLDQKGLLSIITASVFLQTAGPYFFPNQFSIDYSFVPGGSWSLAVEEAFYFAAPLVLFLLFTVTSNLHNIIKSLFFLALAAIPIRLFMTREFSLDDPNWHFASFIQFHSRYDEILAGILSAVLIRTIPDLKKWSCALSFITIILFAIFLGFMFAHPVYLTNPNMMTRDTVWFPTLLGATGASFILSSYDSQINLKTVIVLARLSYPLYLMHIFVCEVLGKSLLAKFIEQSFGVQSLHVIALAWSIFFSWVMSLIVEYPFVRIYKRSILTQKFD